MGEIREVYKDILAEYPNCGGFMPVDKFMAEVKRIVSYYMIQKHFSENYYVLNQRSSDKDKISNRSPQLSDLKVYLMTHGDFHDMEVP